MKFDCKSLFYFEKNDKRAIIIFLSFITVLIFIKLGSWYLYGKGDKDTIQASISYTQYIINSHNHQQKLLIDDSIKTTQYIPPKYLSVVRKKRKLRIGETINLNTCSMNDLIAVPGIGKIYATKIVKYRTMLKHFHSISQLKSVGIKPKLLRKITPYILL